MNLLTDKKSKTKYALFLIGLIVISVIYSAIFGFNDLKKVFSSVTGQTAIAAKAYAGEDWTLNNLSGQPITLSEYKNQPVILVFWATWCPYCKKLLPGIARLNDKYAELGLKVIAVNIKEDWKPEVYWRNHGYQFDAVLAGDEVAKIYAVRGTPTIVFIQPGGKVAAVKSFSDPENPLLDKFAKYYTDQIQSAKTEVISE